MLVAVDTGGTKTLIALFGYDGRVQKTIKFPTPKKQEDYVDLVRKTLQENFSEETIEAVTIGIPGIVKNGVAVWCNKLGWKDFNVASAFANVLGSAPIFVENDANLAGLGEARALTPIPLSVLYVTVSTGIGTGIITNGQIDPGLRLSEGGLALVEFEGEVRQWETFASGKAIFETYGMYARDIKSEKVWQEIADRISRGFFAMIPLVQPEVIVIGGSMGTYFPQYEHQLLSILQKKLPPHIPCPKFLQASHPEEAVVYGCYYYAVDHLTDK